jgi:release factor glutamine methyltransferase
MQHPNPRVLSPYEKNQLRKHDIPEHVALESESPVEYLTHHVDFCKLDFYVNEHVLIPRIETEELVDMAVKHAQNIYKITSKKLNIIDIGTGSGAIPICVSTRLNELNIPFEFLATEVSKEALTVAKKNTNNLAPKESIKFKENNLLDSIEEKFDLIIANLPYIPKARIEFLDKSVKNFEPHIALDGGNSGLVLIHKMINQAESLVYPHTKILLEVDYTHGYDDFNDFRHDWNIVVTPDSSEGVHFVELGKKQ